MDNQFEPLMSGEVISVDRPEEFSIGHKTFKAREFIEALKREFLKQNSGSLSEEQIGWLTDRGIECQALKFGASGWQKGKIRISLEFLPEESESVQGSIAPQSKQSSSNDSEAERSPVNLVIDSQSNSEQEEEFINWEDEDDGLDLETISKNIDEELELVGKFQENPFVEEEEFEVNSLETEFLESFSEEGEFDFPSFDLDDDGDREQSEVETSFEDIWQDVSQYR